MKLRTLAATKVSPADNNQQHNDRFDLTRVLYPMNQDYFLQHKRTGMP